MLVLSITGTILSTLVIILNIAIFMRGGSPTWAVFFMGWAIVVIKSIGDIFDNLN